MRRSRLHLLFAFVLLWGMVVGNGNQVVHAAQRTGKILSYFYNGNSNFGVVSYVYSKDGMVSEGATIPDGVRWAVVSNYKDMWNDPVKSPGYMYNKDGETLTTDDPWKIPADARWATIYQFVIVAPNHTKDQTYLYSTDGITEQTGKSVPENAVWATLYESHNGWGTRLVNMSFTTYERTDNIPPTGEFLINGGALGTNQEKVSLSITASDDSSSVEMRFSNDDSTWSSWEPYRSSREWYLTTGEEQKNVYMQLRDEAGNTVKLKQQILLDKTAPIIMGATEGQTYQAPVTLAWSEGTAILDGVTIQQGHIVKSNGNHLLTVTDVAGNEKKLTFTLAIPAPVVTMQINQGAIVTNKSEVTLGLTASGGSGNLKMRFSHDKETWSDWEQAAPSLLKSWILTDGDGQKKVFLELQDESGGPAVLVSDDIELDTTAPIITDVTDGEIYHEPVTPKWNEGTAKVDGLPIESDDIVIKNGQHTLVVTDLAGNMTTVSFVLEIFAPAVEVQINQGAEYTNKTEVSLEIKASEEKASEMMRLSNDKKTWGPWEPVQSPKTWLIDEGDGQKTVYLAWKDSSGNLVSASDSIILDTTAPVVTGVTNGETYQKAVTISFNEGTATLNGSPFQSGNTVRTSGSYTLLVTDKAELVTKVEFRLDLQLPPPPPPPPQPNTPVTGVELDQSELELLLNAAPVTLKANVLPSHATNKSVTWSSSDSEVAEVNQNGTVTPKAIGTAKITVTTLDGNKTATAVVVVKQDLQLEISKKEILLKPNASMTFKIYAVTGGKKKDITKNKDTIYEADDELVTVTAGKVRAGKKEGSSVITISYQGKTVEIPVTVTNVTVTSLEAKQKQAVLETEDELPIKITAIFSDKSKKDVTELIEWSVKDAKVVSISAEGILTAKNSGETEITAVYGGKKLKIKVLVMDEKKPDEIKLNLSEVDIKVKKTAKLVLTAYYPNGFEEDITAKASWLSKNKNIATVKKGVITGKAEGTTVIVVKYGKEELEVSVNVTKK